MTLGLGRWSETGLVAIEGVVNAADRHIVLVVVAAAVLVLGLATRLRGKKHGVRGPTGVAVAARAVFRPFPLAVVIGLGYLADRLSVDTAMADGVGLARRHPVVTGAMALVLAVGLVAHVVSGRRPTPATRGRRWLAACGRPGNVFAVLAVGALLVLGREYRAQTDAVVAADQRAAALESAAESTGPKLLTWDWPRALHGLPAGVSNTYYRGNDERSDKLFNNGNYRTATFRIGLTDGHGRDVSPGPMNAGDPLSIRWEIVRSPGTAENFFSPRLLGKCFVAADFGSRRPIVPLTTAVPGRSWRADLPIGAVPDGAGYHAVRGVWYCCLAPTEDPATRTLATAIVHYYVQYVLHFQDGELLPASTVWMAPVYPSPALHGTTADGEWFSDRPIPEITGENTTDPKLLGLPGSE